jgi:hypothetical protein
MNTPIADRPGGPFFGHECHRHEPLAAYPDKPIRSSSASPPAARSTSMRACSPTSCRPCSASR